MRHFCSAALGCLPPLATAVGGVVAQEALIALTGKFSPLQQWVRVAVFTRSAVIFLCGVCLCVCVLACSCIWMRTRWLGTWGKAGLKTTPLLSQSESFLPHIEGKGEEFWEQGLEMCRGASLFRCCLV